MGNKKTYKERQNVKHRKSLGLSGYNIRSSRKSEVVEEPEFVLSPKKAPIEQVSLICSRLPNFRRQFFLCVKALLRSFAKYSQLSFFENRSAQLF